MDRKYNETFFQELYDFSFLLSDPREIDHSELDDFFRFSPSSTIEEVEIMKEVYDELEKNHDGDRLYVFFEHIRLTVFTLHIRNDRYYVYYCHY